MKKEELVLALRTEAWEIRELIKKMQKRLEKLDSLADDIESEGKPKSQEPRPPSQFRKIVDSIYGENPKPKSKG